MPEIVKIIEGILLKLAITGPPKQLPITYIVPEKIPINIKNIKNIFFKYFI